MKNTLRTLAFSFSIIFIAGCELNSIELDNTVLKGDEIRKTSKASIEETYHYGEIFNYQTLQAEYQAIEGGFEPEVGIEERLALLEYYEDLANNEMYLVTGFRFPIPGGKMPLPPCPPNPRADCRIPKVDIRHFVLSVFCQNPETISSSITTEEGILAELSDIEYDDEHQMALITYDLINPELSEFVSTVNVTTAVIVEGKEQELTIQMPVVGGIFN